MSLEPDVLVVPRLGANQYLSLCDGQAGIAYFLHRLSIVRSDELMLRLAMRYAQSAALVLDLDAVPRYIKEIRPSRSSLAHGKLGAYYIYALVAASVADESQCESAISGLTKQAASHSEDGWFHQFGIFDGRGGIIFAYCSLRERLKSNHPTLEPLRRITAGLFDRCVDYLGTLDIGREVAQNPLGYSHGIVGCLYVCLRYCGLTATAIPDGVTDCLEQLYGFTQAAQSNISWAFPENLRAYRYAGSRASLCNGLSGLLKTWLAAYGALRDERFLEAAHGCALACEAIRIRTAPSVCCGLAGQAYALLELGRTMRDDRWQAKAVEVAEEAANLIVRNQGNIFAPRTSLLKGQLGVALLAEELFAADEARTRLF